jgi:lysozyme
MHMLYRFLLPIFLISLTSAMGTDARVACETLDISDRGIKLIQHFESCELQPYQDVGKLWTVGWGHLIRDNERDNLMRGVSKEQADALLKADLKAAITPVRSEIKAPLFQHEFDGLVSFVYNLGGANFASSTLRKRLNEQLYHEASLEFPRWNKVSGKFCRGIFKRRMAEMLIFRKDCTIPDLLPECRPHYLELSTPLKEEIAHIYNEYYLK